jgi:hypothetical protein
LRRDILIAGRVDLVAAAFQQARVDERGEAASQHAGRDAQVGLQLVEPGVPVEDVAKDEQAGRESSG